MDFARRIRALRERLAARGVDAALIANDASWEYFTGLPRMGVCPTKMRQNSLEFSCLLVTDTKVTAFAPRLSALGFSGRMGDFPVVDVLICYPDVDIRGAAFEAELKAQGLGGKRIGVNRDISSTCTLFVMERLGAQVVDISCEVDALRKVKDADEIALMRRASEITDQLYREVTPLLVPGTPIREIEREIERRMEGYGCSYPSFPAEVLNYGPKAGPMIGMPYGTLDREHVAAYDFGVVYKGYCSDFGRTVFLSEPDAELIRAHELVMRAQQAALDACVIGVSTCAELNDACHAVMREAGVDEHFIHRMGHCIGKDVHERPFMAEGEDTVVVPGMTFTDEPSLFLPGKGCVRVEDVVLVTETGFEFLNKITKEIVVVG